MDTEFLFVFRFLERRFHTLSRGALKTTLVSTPVCPQQKHSALYHLTAINIPYRAGPC